jgi:hypothetical protein
MILNRNPGCELAERRQLTSMPTDLAARAIWLDNVSTGRNANWLIGRARAIRLDNVSTDKGAN